MEVWALGIAIVSALFAGLAWWQTKEMVGLERVRDAKGAIDAASAQVVPAMVPGVNNQGKPVKTTCVRNIGSATAQGVTVALEGIEGSEDMKLPRYADYAFPCDIAPGGEVRLHVSHTIGSAPRAIVVTSWTDGNGDHTERTTFSFV